MIVNKYYKVIRVIKDGGDGPTPFYIENISGEDGVFFTGMSSSSYIPRNLMYKVDDGEWFEYTDNGTMKIDVPNGSRIYLKGDNPLESYGYAALNLTTKQSSNKRIKCNIGGYLTSLIQSNNFDEVDTIPNKSFVSGFLYSELVSASNLITSNIKYIGSNAFSGFFQSCTSLTSLPEGMFANVISVGDYAFQQCFQGCTSLTSLPEGMFANVTSVGSNAFERCFTSVKLTTLPEGMFANVTSVGSNSFLECFYNCTSLTSLPEGMFANVTSVGEATFKTCFRGCSSLTSLPEGMFANVTSVEKSSFNECFFQCTSLQSLSKGMFANVTSVYIYSFQSCFRECTSLTSLPTGMFAKLTSVSSNTFGSCFANNPSLTTLPEGMFANVTTVGTSSFTSCFVGCTSLLIGPNFKNVTGSTSHDAFDRFFYNCTSLQLIYAPQMSAWNESYFQDWVSGVYPTGKMYVKSGVVPPTGVSGVPEGWQLLNY